MNQYPVATNLRHAAKALEDDLKVRDYGSFVDFKTLNTIAGVDISTPKYRYVLEAAKRALLRHHDRVLVSVRGKGYEIATTPQCIAASAGYRKRSYRAAKTSFEIVNTVDLSKVSDAERDKIVSEQCKAGALLVTYKACENKLLNSPGPRVLNAPTETDVVKLLLDISKKS
jgi:hypothetical protein